MMRRLFWGRSLQERYVSTPLWRVSQARPFLVLKVTWTVSHHWPLHQSHVYTCKDWGPKDLIDLINTSLYQIRGSS